MRLAFDDAAALLQRVRGEFVLHGILRKKPDGVYLAVSDISQKRSES